MNAISPCPPNLGEIIIIKIPAHIVIIVNFFVSHSLCTLPPASLDRTALPKNYKSSISARQETPFANLDYHKVQLKFFETEKLGELFYKRLHSEP